MFSSVSIKTNNSNVFHNKKNIIIPVFTCLQLNPNTHNTITDKKVICISEKFKIKYKRTRKI